MLHAENESHLPHLCFPGERHWEGEDRERKKIASLYHARRSCLWPQPLAGATMAVYSQRACPTQAAPLAEPLTALSTPPAASLATTGHRALARDRATRALNPPRTAGHQPWPLQQAESCHPSPSARAGPALPVCTAPSWENLPSSWKAALQGPAWAREQPQPLSPLYFPPAGQFASGQLLWVPAGCVLLLLKSKIPALSQGRKSLSF